jgi:hypothetical protein
MEPILVILAILVLLLWVLLALSGPLKGRARHTMVHVDSETHVYVDASDADSCAGGGDD